MTLPVFSLPDEPRSKLSLVEEVPPVPLHPIFSDPYRDWADAYSEQVLDPLHTSQTGDGLPVFVSAVTPKTPTEG